MAINFQNAMTVESELNARVASAQLVPPVAPCPPALLYEHRRSPLGSCTACGNADSFSSIRPLPRISMLATPPLARFGGAPRAPARRDHRGRLTA